MYDAQTLTEEFVDIILIHLKVSPGTKIDEDLTKASMNSSAFPDYKYNFNFNSDHDELQVYIYPENNASPIPVDALSPKTRLFTVYWNGPASSPPCIENINFIGPTFDNSFYTTSGNWCFPQALVGIDEVCFDAGQITVGGRIHQDHNLFSNLGLYNACSVNHGARNVTVRYFDETGQALCSDITENDGLYSCNKLKPCRIKVEPYKEDHIDCGLTFEDVERITQHYITQNPFQQKWQYFAADVNGDHFIDVRDNVHIVKVILNQPLPGFNPWMFVKILPIIPGTAQGVMAPHLFMKSIMIKHIRVTELMKIFI